jgi:hypothetical protein
MVDIFLHHKKVVVLISFVNKIGAYFNLASSEASGSCGRRHEDPFD